MKQYEDFEIVVEKVTGVDIFAVSVKRACGGKQGDASGSFRLEEVSTPTSNGSVDPGTEKRHVKVLAQGKEYSVFGERPLSTVNANSAGEQLSRALFKQEITQLWGQCLQYPALRIRLDLSSAPELSALPWEYLRSPGRMENFVGLDDKSTLVRYLRSPYGVRPLKVIPPLRILVMTSSPEELRQLAVNDEVQRIKNALAGLSAENIQVVALERATLASLEKTLKSAREQERPFHIFHYIGHGAFDTSTNDGKLLFEDAAGKADPVDAETIAQLLQPYRSDLRLIFLNACVTARHSAKNIYSSVAAKAVEIAEIPAAIAMQYEISDTAAITFAEAFYRELGSGEPLERSVDVGRAKVRAIEKTKDEWATPVLFLRSVDGHLFDIKIPKPPEKLRGHYAKLATLLPTCNLVIFLGLDVNLAGRSKYDPWRPEAGLPLPCTDELRSYLARSFELSAGGESLAALAQRLTLLGEPLPDVLEEIFDRPAKSTKLYQVLGRLTKKVTDKLPDVPTDPCHGSMLFVTTTYDRALELAFEDAGITEYHTICYGQGEDGNWLFIHRFYSSENGGPIRKVSEVFLEGENDPNTYRGLRGKAPVILKLPGEVSKSETKYAITEDDFFAIAQRGLSNLLPADLLTQIQTSRHLYLGYDLQNWTLRLLRTRLCENQKSDIREKSYAVVFDELADPNVPFWKENKVKFATANLDDYVAGLERFVLDEL